jgi:hypothetical protein
MKNIRDKINKTKNKVNTGKSMKTKPQIFE